MELEATWSLCGVDLLMGHLGRVSGVRHFDGR